MDLSIKRSKEFILLGVLGVAPPFFYAQCHIRWDFRIKAHVLIGYRMLKTKGFGM